MTLQPELAPPPLRAPAGQPRPPLETDPVVTGPMDRASVRLLVACALSAAMAGLLWLLLGRPQLGIDDADITRVYARHLAEGHGLVYTPGFEWVEGYSSTAWMLAWAAAYWLFSDPVPAIAALSLLLCGCSVAALLGSARRLAGGPLTGLALAALLVTIPTFFAWNTLTLMDLGLWTALIAGFVGIQGRTLLTHREHQPVWPLALVLVGLAWTRPEGLALAPACLGLAVLAQWARGHGLKGSLRHHGLPAFALGLALLGLFAFRLQTFGYPFPNTYYAKVSPDRTYNLIEGAKYTLDFLSMPWMALFAPLALAVLAGGCLRRSSSSRRRDPALIFATLSAAVAWMGLALPLVEGGDHFGGHRLLQPFLIPAAIPALFLLGRLEGLLPAGARARLTPPLPLTALFLLVAMAPSWTHFQRTSRLEREFQIATHGRGLGEALNQALSSYRRPSLGVVTAGGIALTYEGRVLDLMGLNWSEMAHAPGQRYGVKNHAAFQPNVFWTAPPDLVVPRLMGRRPRAGETPSIDFDQRVLTELFESQRFQDSYEPRVIPAGQGFVFTYARREWSASPAAVPAGLPGIGR